MKLPNKKFNCILCDPAWTFKTRSAKGLDGRPQHYKRMTLDEIKALDVAGCADKDCWLFLWTTGPHLPQAFEVIKAWGFKYSAMGFVWIKLNKNAKKISLFGKILICLSDIFMGGGYTTRKNAEYCLLARRGSPKRLSKKVHEVIIEPRREHSRKPEEAYRRIEEYCKGPRLELFARHTRKGWTACGDETDKFEES